MKGHPGICLLQTPCIARPVYTQLSYRKKGDGKCFWEIKNISSFSSRDNERDILKIDSLRFGNHCVWYRTWKRERWFRAASQWLERGQCYYRIGDVRRMKDQGGRERDSVEVPIGVLMELRIWGSGQGPVRHRSRYLQPRRGRHSLWEWAVHRVRSSRQPYPPILLWKPFYFHSDSFSLQGPSWFSPCLPLHTLNRPSP